MRASEHLPERFNAAEHFVCRHVAEGRGSRVAFVEGTATITYEALDLHVRRFAAAIRRAGVNRGERVAFLLHDGATLAAGFWVPSPPAASPCRSTRSSNPTITRRSSPTATVAS